MELPVTVQQEQAYCVVSTLHLRTSRAREFIDITDDVLELIAAGTIRSGIAVVTSRHTTASIVINEHEPLLHEDLDRMLAELAPDQNHYAHNTAPCEPGEFPNGHAHCQALLLNASATIPIVDGRAVLGRYQRVFLVELDRARPRAVTIMLLGT